MIDLEWSARVARVTLNRPPVNAMSAEWVARFHSILDQLAERDDWSVLHLRSAQKLWSAGADLRQLEVNFKLDIEQQLDLGRSYQRLFQRLQDVPAITVAEIGGTALGGGLELALSCDLRIASSRAKFGFPEVTLGLIPGAGGTQRLSWLCGRPVASRLILTGQIVDGAEAHRLGLVQWVHEHDAVAAQAELLVEQCAALPRHATAGAKTAIFAASDPSQDGFLRETEVVRDCLQSAATRELVAAFLRR